MPFRTSQKDEEDLLPSYDNHFMAIHVSQIALDGILRKSARSVGEKALPQHCHRLLYRLHHEVDFLLGVVEGERGADGAGNAVVGHHRLGAVMPRAYGDTHLVDEQKKSALVKIANRKTTAKEDPDEQDQPPTS